MTVHLLAISGSLRSDSLNTRLLVVAQKLMGQGVQMDFARIGDIPHYNADLSEAPGPVQTFKDQIATAEGVLIATPEFNYGIPGVLKNALDWASRPAYKSVFAQKPVAILGASPSTVGTARAQGQLKHVLLGMVAELFPHPEIAIGAAAAKLGPDGDVTDERTKEQLQRFLVAYLAWLNKRSG
jgi:chromate reductase, NAD(P)H dehydrogenase (quinone)